LSNVFNPSIRRARFPERGDVDGMAGFWRANTSAQNPSRGEANNLLFETRELFASDARDELTDPSNSAQKLSRRSIARRRKRSAHRAA
jgi:hypothetical protein